MLKHTFQNVYFKIFNNLKMCDESKETSDLQELILLTNPRSKLYTYGKPKCGDFALDELIFYEFFQVDSLFRAPTQTRPTTAGIVVRAGQPTSGSPEPKHITLWIKGVIDRQKNLISFYRYVPTNPDVPFDSKINQPLRSTFYSWGFEFSNIANGTYTVNGVNGYKYINDTIWFYPQTFTVSFDVVSENVNVAIRNIDLTIGGVNIIPEYQRNFTDNSLDFTLQNNSFGKLHFTLREEEEDDETRLKGTMQMNNGYTYNIGFDKSKALSIIYNIIPRDPSQ